MFRSTAKFIGLFLIAGVVFAGAFSLLVFSLQDREPKYEGKTIPEWTAVLRQTDPTVAGAARNIVTHKVVPALCSRMLQDINDSRMKLATVDLLNAVPGIYIYAADARARRFAAAHNLGEFGAEAQSAIPDLIRCIQGNDETVRLAAIYSIGKIRTDSKTTIPLLIQCLDDPEEDIKIAAAESLGEFGPEAKAAVPKLVPLLTFHSKKLPSSAHKSISQIDPQYFSSAAPESKSTPEAPPPHNSK